MKVKNLSCGFSYLCREKNGSSCIFGFHSILKWTSKKSPPTYAQEMKTFPLLIPRWHHSSFCKTSNLKKKFADVWIGWSLIQRVLKCLWQACQCLQRVLDQAPWDTRKQIFKGIYFPVMPSLQPFPQRAQLTDYFHRSPGNSMHSIRKLDDRRHWILSFDTFPVEMCWFPSPKCFWINFV